MSILENSSEEKKVGKQTFASIQFFLKKFNYKYLSENHKRICIIYKKLIIFHLIETSIYKILITITKCFSC